MFGDAPAYERFMGRWSVLLAPAFLDAVRLDAVRAPTRVVDVGSGTGHLTRAVAARWPGCTVLGVDPAVGFVEVARRQARAEGVSDRVRFEPGEAGALPAGSGTVDAAVALLVLTFVPDPERAVAEMLRVTRAGGVVAAAVWDYGGGMGMLRALWDAAARIDPSVVGQDEASAPLGRAGGLADLWRASGLEDLADGAVSVRLTYPTFQDYWDPFLGGTGPAGVHVAGLSDAGRAALRAQLRSDLGPGPVELTSRAWWVRGTVPG